MMKKIYLVRHAQALHNVPPFDVTQRDPELTLVGLEQSRDLHYHTQGNLQGVAQLLVVSPQVRALQTMVRGFPDLIADLQRKNKGPVVLDILQEMHANASDIPTHPPSALALAQDGLFADFDFSSLSEGYASKEGIFAPANIKERAEQVLHWLYAREEEEIVVVAHGDLLRIMTAWPEYSPPWDNTEIKVFTFKEDKLMLELVEVETAVAGDASSSA